MRFACFLIGLGLVSVACGEASSGDLFAPTGTQATVGSTAATGSSTASTSTTAAGSDVTGSAVGAGGSAATGGSGGDTGGSAGVGGSPGTGGNGGATGAGGDVIGTGVGGASGGLGGTGNAGAAGSGMGGSAGAAGTGGSAGGSVDAGTPHPIHCGNTVCTAQKEFCCIQDSQGTQSPRCVSNGGICSDAADRVYCDDRSDCMGTGEVCCAADNLSGGSSTAACVAAAQCANLQRKSQQLCDPQQPGQCGLVGMTNPCRADTNATIPGYAYCH